MLIPSLHSLLKIQFISCAEILSFGLHSPAKDDQDVVHLPRQGQSKGCGMTNDKQQLWLELLGLTTCELNRPKRASKNGTFETNSQMFR